MYQKPCPLKDVPKREIALRIWAYGIPISIGFLSYSLDWWEKLASAPCRDRPPARCQATSRVLL